MKRLRRAGLAMASTVRFAAVLALAFASARVPLAAQEDLSQSERAWLDGRKKIVIGCEYNYPPYEFLENGMPEGILIELFRWISAEYGFKLELLPIGLYEAQKRTLSGDIDAISSMFITAERTKAYGFTRPVFLVPTRLFVRAERPDIKSLSDLKGKRVAVPKGDYAEEFLVNAGIACEFVYSGDFEGSAEMVISGEADALVGDEQAVLYFLFSRNKRSEIKLVGDPIYVGDCRPAVKKGNDKVLAVLDKGISKAMATGVYDRIERKWLGESFAAKDLMAVAWQYILIPPSILVLVVIAVIAWNRQLKKRVDERTRELDEARAGLEDDIRERIRVEGVLRDIELRYRGLFDNTPDSIFWVSVLPGNRFAVESMNPAQLAALSLSEEEVVGREPDAIFPEPFGPLVMKRYAVCAETGEHQAYEERIPNGSEERWFQTTLVPIKGDQGSVIRIVGFSREITRSKKAEALLLHSQKLESLGVLAGGIAHDFNNILQAIMGNLNLAALDLDEGHKAKGCIDQAVNSALRAADLCRQLLAYSGRGRFVIRSVDVDVMIEDMLKMLKVSVFKKTTLELRLRNDLPPVIADEVQLRQILMNLVINASESLGENSGKVTIGTRLARVTEGQITTPWITEPLSPGDYVVLTVEDSGCGMEYEKIAKIFDPFFSTKFTGRGLGLAAVLGIVRSHKGAILVESELGKGSVFSVYLPAEPSRTMPEILNPRNLRQIPLSGTALFVDDEEEIRKTGMALLAAMGFDSICAKDGREAVDMIKSRYSYGVPNEPGDRLSCVLLDMTMPEMDGEEACSLIKRLVPDLPVIIMSGYSGQEIESRFSGVDVAAFLQKPWNLESLTVAVSKALSGYLPTR